MGKFVDKKKKKIVLHLCINAPTNNFVGTAKRISVRFRPEFRQISILFSQIIVFLFWAERAVFEGISRLHNGNAELFW